MKTNYTYMLYPADLKHLVAFFMAIHNIWGLAEF